jgi:hypothetical protein
MKGRAEATNLLQTITARILFFYSGKPCIVVLNRRRLESYRKTLIHTPPILGDNLIACYKLSAKNVFPNSQDCGLGQ